MTQGLLFIYESSWKVVYQLPIAQLKMWPNLNWRNNINFAYITGRREEERGRRRGIGRDDLGLVVKIFCIMGEFKRGANLFFDFLWYMFAKILLLLTKNNYNDNYNNYCCYSYLFIHLSPLVFGGIIFKINASQLYLSLCWHGASIRLLYLHVLFVILMFFEVDEN